MTTLNDLQKIYYSVGGGAALSLGHVDGALAVNKFGSADEVPTTFVTVWPDNSVKIYRTTGAIMSVSSGSGVDAAAGIGAHTVTIYGVDGNWAAVKETVVLEGQDAVLTDNEYMIVYRMIVGESGSSGTNVGALYVGTGVVALGVPAVPECITPAAEGQSEAAFFPVPAGTKFLLDQAAITGVAAGKEVEAHLRVKPFGGSWNTKIKVRVIADTFSRTLTRPILVPAKSIVEVLAKVDATTAWASATFGGTIVDAPESTLINMR